MANRTQLQAALQKPYNRQLFAKDVLSHVFGAGLSVYNSPAKAPVQPNKSEAAVIGNVNIYAAIQLEDGTDITCYEIALQPGKRVEQNKVAIQQYIRKLLTAGQAALVNFITPENLITWRLTLIAKDSEITDAGIQERTTHAKRYTYLLGGSQSCYTVAQRLAELGNKVVKGINQKDLTDAFSVAVLTKEFYNELFQWYQWTLSEEVGITFPKNTSIAEDDREKLEEQIIRLITRLLFVWFIKQKQLVPGGLFNITELKKVLKSFNAESTTNGNYYNAVLQNLFFATLNKAVNERAFAKEVHKRDIKTLYRYAEMFIIAEQEVLELFRPIPFLNGGLFECLDKEDIEGNKYFLDGFSRNDTKLKGHFKHRAFIPNCIFFDEQKGIIPLLERYNFTVEENSPEDVQVALDPELLGNVFENLLGVYNPETKESARKQSGSFYTPREIVGFMVSESLIAYLNNACPQLKPGTIRSLFENEVLPEELQGNEQLCKEISGKLRAVKILDPACGSGAFPMGILKKMVEVLDKLDLTNAKTVYEQKLHLIEECIYGVDIQTIAAQISKLRFFISLICEQEEIDLSRPEENYGVITLPNLETKFVAANTLIGLGAENKHLLDLNDSNLLELKNKLWLVRHNHFYATKASEKRKLRDEDEKLREDIKDYIADNTFKPNPDIIELNTSQLQNLQKERKNYKGEKWIEETGKPEQASLFGETTPKQHSLFRIDINKRETERIDRAIKDAQAAIERENNKTRRAGFDAAIEMLSKWDPYDQNASSSFFDAEWMFGLQTGFDIVIGNPPYVQLQKNGGALAKQFEKAGYKTFERTGDIYSLFYEKGLELLKPKGHLIFITSNKWMRAGYGESTRNFFAQNANPVLLIDFAGQKIFDAATVDTNILLLSKENNQEKTLACTVKEKVLNNLSVFVRQAGNSCAFINADSWVILSDIEQRIKAKIEAIGTPLKDWDIQINYGIKTGFNDAFIIDGQKRKKLIEQDLNSEEIIRPILRGRDIKRYGYEFADLYLITTFPSLKIDIEQYPAVKQHLLSFGYDRLKQTGDAGARKKTSNKWFETQDSINYRDDFFKQKIMYPNMTKFLPFYLDNKGFMQNDKSFMITGKHLAYLTAFLNSSLFKYCFINNFPELQGGTRELRKFFLDKIPVLPISDRINLEFEKIVLALQVMGKQQSIKHIEIEIDEKIFNLYSLTPEEKKEIGFIEIQ